MAAAPLSDDALAAALSQLLRRHGLMAPFRSPPLPVSLYPPNADALTASLDAEPVNAVLAAAAGTRRLHASAFASLHRATAAAVANGEPAAESPASSAAHFRRAALRTWNGGHAARERLAAAAAIFPHLVRRLMLRHGRVLAAGP